MIWITDSSKESSTFNIFLRISNTAGWHLGWDGMSTYSQTIIEGRDNTDSTGGKRLTLKLGPQR